MSGNGIGSALVTDTATPTVAGSNQVQPTTPAVDFAGNVYFIDLGTNSVLKANTASGVNSAVAPGSAPANANQTAVDTQGNVYVASTGSASYVQYVQNTDGTYTANTLTPAFATLPEAVVVDAIGNTYIADKTTGRVFEMAVGSAFSTSQPTLTLSSGYSNPIGLALDGVGNLFVADSGTSSVSKIAFVNGVPTTTLYAGATGATVTASFTPQSIAADTAGNLYIQDAVSKSLIEIPAVQTGPTSITVLTGQAQPAGVAVDGTGAVYASDADGTKPNLRLVRRNALTFDFGTSTSVVFSGTISNVGNQTATGFQATGQDAAEFPLTSVSPTNCANSRSILAGYACSVTTQFTPGSGTGNVSSTLAYTPAASTTGFLKLTATKSGAAVTTTTTIGTQNPANPIYSVSGTEVTFPVTVAASDSSTPTGSVSVSVDAGVAFTSYATGQTGLEFGRPYGTYSTWLLLNSYIDQVAPAGYIEFSNGTNNLPTSTYDEYNARLGPR